LQTLLDYLGSGDDAFLHFLHHIGFDFDGQIVGRDGFSGVESSLLEEGFEVVIGVTLTLVVLVFSLVFFEFLTCFVVEGLFDGEEAKSHLFVFFADGEFLISDGLVAFLLFRQ
jgi:hypothetical protein